MTNENEKSYEEIIAELQTEIADRNKADHSKLMKEKVTERLIKHGYTETTVVPMLEVIPDFSTIEDEGAAYKMADKLLELAYINAHTFGYPTKKTNIFK